VSKSQQAESGASAAITNSSRWTGIIDLALILGLWVVALLVVQPFGEFPLNDDWSYAKTVKALVEGKGYQPTAWTEMSLFSHALWGALFCLPGGFSFPALRISTLVLSFGGAIVVYSAIRKLVASRLLARIGALVLLFNPIYFALSNTFMADVTFAAVAAGSAFWYAQFLQSERKTDLILATALAGLATLARQMGLCLPIAFGVMIWMRHGVQSRWLMRMVLPAAVCICLLLGFQYWLKLSGHAPANTMRTERLWAVFDDPLKIPINLAYYGWGMLMYLGWFLSPVLVLGISRRSLPQTKQAKLTVWIALGMFGLITALRFILRPSLMPVHNNIIIPQGVGPLVLRDVFDLNLPHVPSLPGAFWLLITVLSLVAAVVLLVQFLGFVMKVFSPGRFVAQDTNDPKATFYLLCCLIYLAPFLLSGYFDRYLLPVLAFLLMFFAIYFRPMLHTLSSWRVAGAVGLLAMTGIFGVLATHDYLAWNRVRWQALEHLEAQQIAPEDIDGGFEFNAWHQFGLGSTTNIYNNAAAYSAWAATVPYLLAFGPVEGFVPIATNTCSRWLPPLEGQILVLKRQVSPAKP